MLLLLLFVCLFLLLLVLLLMLGLLCTAAASDVQRSSLHANPINVEHVSLESLVDVKENLI